MKIFVAAFLLLLLAPTAQAFTDDKGEPFPSFGFVDAGGRRLDLSAFTGKVVLVDFWASWCGPCRAEFPSLDRLQGEMKEQGLVVLPISLDRMGMPAVDRFYRELNVVNLDKYVGSQDVAQAVALRGVPTALVFDRQGRLVLRLEGTAQWDGPKMKRAFGELLK